MLRWFSGRLSGGFIFLLKSSLSGNLCLFASGSASSVRVWHYQQHLQGVCFFTNNSLLLQLFPLTDSFTEGVICKLFSSVLSVKSLHQLSQFPRHLHRFSPALHPLNAVIPACLGVDAAPGAGGAESAVVSRGRCRVLSGEKWWISQQSSGSVPAAENHLHHPPPPQPAAPIMLSVISVLQAALLPLNTPGQQRMDMQEDTHTHKHKQAHKQITHTEAWPIYWCLNVVLESLSCGRADNAAGDDFFSPMTDFLSQNERIFKLWREREREREPLLVVITLNTHVHKSAEVSQERVVFL